MSEPSTEAKNRRRFELRKRIGAGAYGEVFLAEQVSSGGFRRPVALKLLNETAARMKEASRRMRDEARILGRLSHRHIVEVLDLVQIGDRWAVVMAYVPGADLEQVLAHLEGEGRAVPGPAACEVGAAIGRALAAAWAATDEKGRPMRVVHRDIKPSNVRITHDGEVKVLDFGIARVELDGREAQTRKPVLMGTERYMSPERLLLEGDGPPGDVYAMAATVVELITGQPIGRSPVRDEPHKVFADGASHALMAYLRGPHEVIEAIVDTVRLALDSDPTRRPDATAFARVMDEGARKLEGDSLAQFAAEVVSSAARRAEAELESATGTLIEGSTPAPASLGGEEVGPPPPTRDPRGLVRVALALAGLALLATMGRIGAAALREPDATVMPSDGTPGLPEADATATQAPVAPSAPSEPLGAATAEPLGSPDATVAPAAPLRGPDATGAPATQPKARSATVMPSATHAALAPTVEAAPPTATSAGVAPVAPPAPAGPRVSRAMVVVTDVSGIDVTCGDKVFHGTSSVRIVDFPSGECTVRAERGGTWFRGSIRIDAPREVVCTVQGDALSCHG